MLSIFCACKSCSSSFFRSSMSRQSAALACCNSYRTLGHSVFQLRLVLAQCFLRLVALSDVLKNDHQPDNLAITVPQWRRRIGDRKEPPVFPDESIFEVLQGLALAQHLKASAFLGGEGRTVGMFIMGDIVHFLPAQFFERPTKQFLRRRIHLGHQALFVHRIKSLNHVRHDRFIKLHRAPQCFVRLLALGDVASDFRCADDFGLSHP